MASAEQCERALHDLAHRLSANGAARKTAELERTLSCTLRDLEVSFGGRLYAGQLTDIQLVAEPDAQVRLAMSSDDLIALVDGSLAMASAWATGRVRIDAGVRDLIRLRSVF